MPTYLSDNLQPLISYFQQGEKHPHFLAMGVEHEQFLFFKESTQRVPYEGPRGIRSLLEDFTEHGWQATFEEDNPIALTYPFSRRGISLEPGGQFEFSGAPWNTLHQVFDELTVYLQQLDSILSPKNIERIGLGFDPFTAREEVPWMPKKRYQIMRNYMPTRGEYGLDMMTRTCTIQVNLDYISETDFVQKMRVSMGLQPILSALFANSHQVEGKDSGYKSYRNFVWLGTDPDRSGLLPFVFEEDMSYERYVRYLLQVPLYFIIRQGHMLPCGQPFQDFLDKKLALLPGQSPTLDDWIQHVSMVFPEVRLKRYLEIRAADSGSDNMITALAALWVGLLYDAQNLKDCHNYIQQIPFSAIQQTYQQVPKTGLMTILQERPIGFLARQLVERSAQGLKRRKKLNVKGQDERIYLDPLFSFLEKAGF